MHDTNIGTWLRQYTILGDWLIHDTFVCNQSLHHKIVGNQSMHHVTNMLHVIFVFKARFIRKDISVCSLTLNLLTTTIVAPPSNASKWQMGFNSAFKRLMTPNNQNPMCEHRAMLCALSFGLEFLSSSLLSKNVSIKTHRIRTDLLFYMGVKLVLPR
jgi:hypothetical protein